MKRYHLSVYEVIRETANYDEIYSECELDNKSFNSLKELLTYLEKDYITGQINDTDVHADGSVELTATYTEELESGTTEFETTYLIECTQTIPIELSENEREDINEILTGTALC